MIIKSDNKIFRAKNFRQLLRQVGYVLAGLIVVVIVFFGVKKYVYGPQKTTKEVEFS